MIMILQFLIAFTRADVVYTSIAEELTISGEGTVTLEGVRSVGDFSRITSVIIQEGIIEIGSFAFDSCKALKVVSIPSSVISISSSSFYRCSSISKYIVAEGNQHYSNDDQYALYNRNKSILMKAPTIQNFRIIESVTEIASFCFSTERGYDMGNIVIPNNVEILNSNSFNEGKFQSITYDDSPQVQIIPSSAGTWMLASSLITFDYHIFKPYFKFILKSF